MFSYNKRTFILGNIYCPPKGNLTEFTSEMCKFIDFICAQFSLDDLYLLDVYNIDFFKFNLNQKYFDFYSIMCSYGLSPAILRPTRVTQHSKTLIDQIWYNGGDPSLNLSSGVILSDLSDHFPIFVQNNARNSSLAVDDAFVQYKCRLKNSGRDRIFRSLLLQVPFENYNESAEVQANCQNFIRDVTTSYETA